MALCRKCSGLGYVRCSNCAGRGVSFSGSGIRCYHCAGTGRALCYTCVGSGEKRESDRYSSSPPADAEGERVPEPTAEKIARVENYFTGREVAVLYLYRELRVGETVHFASPRTRQAANAVDFEQEITSIQKDNEAVEAGSAGDRVAVPVQLRVRKGDLVYEVGP
jgi:hypothetical protein